MAQPLEIVLVGLGGIGSVLGFGVSYSLTAMAQKGQVRVILVDGGNYEPDHIDHEFFQRLGNKASVQRGQLALLFPGILYRSVPFYLHHRDIRDQDGIAVGSVVKEGQWVLAGVDNHKSRKLLSDHCRTLRNVTLISGGNEDDDTMIQVYIRRDGRDITPPLDFMHPDIARPDDMSPVEKAAVEGCEQRIRSGHQSPATLFSTATLIINAFHTLLRLEAEGKLSDIPYREVYWNITKAKMRAVSPKE